MHKQTMRDLKNYHNSYKNAPIMSSNHGKSFIY